MIPSLSGSASDGFTLKWFLVRTEESHFFPMIVPFLAVPYLRDRTVTPLSTAVRSVIMIAYSTPYITSIKGMRKSSLTSVEHGRIAEGDWFWNVQYLPCTTHASDGVTKTPSQINNVAGPQASGPTPLNEISRVTPRWDDVATLTLI